MTSSSRTAAERIRSQGLIAIARGAFTVDELSRTAEALQKAGAHVMEVTLDSPGALEAIAVLHAHYGENMSIGAGTVRSADDVARAIVVSCGPEGAIARIDEELIREPGIDVRVHDRLGAGDALAAGVIHGYLDADFRRGLRDGVALSALALGQYGDGS